MQPESGGKGARVHSAEPLGFVPDTAMGESTSYTLLAS